jgi:hypothetical protein
MYYPAYYTYSGPAMPAMPLAVNGGMAPPSAMAKSQGPSPSHQLLALPQHQHQQQQQNAMATEAGNTIE